MTPLARFTVVAVAATTACHSASRSSAAAAAPSPVGCFAFFDSAGRPAAGRLYWAPAVGRLDSGGRAVRLTPTLDAGRRAGPGAYRWWLGAGDSLWVSFHNGFSGTAFVLALARRGDTLRGRAREAFDAGPREVDAGPASAVRIPCPGAGTAGPRSPDA